LKFKIRTFLNHLSVLVLVFLSACGGEGNQELEEATFGLMIQVVEGDQQILEDPAAMSEDIVIRVTNSEGKPARNTKVNLTLLNPESGAQLIVEDVLTDSSGKAVVRIIGGNDFGKVAQVEARVDGTSVHQILSVAIRDIIVPTRIIIAQPPNQVVAGTPVSLTFRLVDDNGRLAENPEFNTEITAVFSSSSGRTTLPEDFNKTLPEDRLVVFTNGIGILQNVEYKVAETVTVSLSDHGKLADLVAITRRQVNISNTKSYQVVPDTPVRMQLAQPNNATTDDTVIAHARLYDQYDNMAYNYGQLCSINVQVAGFGNDEPWFVNPQNLAQRNKVATRQFASGAVPLSIRDSAVETVELSISSVDSGCSGITNLGTPVTFSFAVGQPSKLVIRPPSLLTANTTQTVNVTVESTDSFGNFNPSFNGAVEVAFSTGCNATIQAGDHVNNNITLSAGTKTVGVNNRNLNRNPSVVCTVSLAPTPNTQNFDLTSTADITFIPGEAKQLAFTDSNYSGEVGWGTLASQRNRTPITVEILDFYGNPVFTYGGGTASVISNGTTEVSSSAKSFSIGADGKGTVEIWGLINETVTLEFASAPAGIRYTVNNAENIDVFNPVNLTASLYYKWGIPSFFRINQPTDGTVDAPIEVEITAHDYGGNRVLDFGSVSTPITSVELVTNSATTTVGDLNMIQGRAVVSVSNTAEQLVLLSLALSSGVSSFTNSVGQVIDISSASEAQKTVYYRWGNINRKLVLTGTTELTVDNGAQIRVQVLDQFDNPVRNFGCSAEAEDVRVIATGSARLTPNQAFDHTDVTSYNSLPSQRSLDISIQSGNCATMSTNPKADLGSDASYGHLYLFNRLITPEGAATRVITVTLEDIRGLGYTLVPGPGLQFIFRPGALAKFTPLPATGTVDAPIQLGIQARDQFDNFVVSYVQDGAVNFNWVDQKSAQILFNGADGREPGNLAIDFKDNDNGRGFIYLTDQVAETVVVGLSAVDQVDTSATANVVFNPGVVTQIAIIPPGDPSQITTDDKSLFKLESRDQYGNHNTSYNSDIRVHTNKSSGTVTNPAEVNPDNYILSQNRVVTINSGNGPFYVYDRVAEIITISMTDDLNRGYTLNPIDVEFLHGVPTQAVIARIENQVVNPDNRTATVSADISANALVNILDRNNNVATSYNNNVSLTIVSGTAELLNTPPASGTLPDITENQTRVVNISSGVGSLYVLSRRAANVNLRLLDTQATGLTMWPSTADSPVVVNTVHGTPNRLGLILPGDSPVTPGSLNPLPMAVRTGTTDTYFDVTINAYDAYNNLASGYNGDVAFAVNMNAEINPASLGVGSSTFTSKSARINLIGGTSSFTIFDRVVESGVNLSLSSNNGTNEDGLNVTHARTVNFSFGEPNYYAIINPTTTVSVDNFATIRIEVRDMYHNIINSTFEGSVDLSVSGDAFLNNAVDINPATGLPASKITTRTINFNPGNSGFTLVNVYNRKAETVSFSLANGVATLPIAKAIATTDLLNPAEEKTQTFVPGAVARLTFQQPTTIDADLNHVTADNALQLEVRAYDFYNNFANNYSADDIVQVNVTNGGSVVTSAGDLTPIANAQLSFGGTFPQGVSRFHVRNTNVGLMNVALSDINATGLIMDDINIRVRSGVPTQLRLIAHRGLNNTGNNPGLVPRTDNPIQVDIVAQDNYNNTVLDFSGSASLDVVSGGEGHSWIGGPTVTNFTNGIGQKEFNKTVVGDIFIGLSATTTPAGLDVTNPQGTRLISVGHGHPIKYGFVTPPSPYVAGDDIELTIQALDVHNNIATSYGGIGRNVNVEYRVGSGTFNSAGSYVPGPIQVAFNAGLATASIRKTTFSTSFPQISESVSIGLTTADDATMDVTSLLPMTFIPADPQELRVVVDPTLNPAGAGPFPIDDPVQLRVESRDQFGNYTNQFNGTVNFTTNRDAWVFQDGVDFDQQNMSIQSSQFTLTNGFATPRVANLAAQNNVNLGLNTASGNYTISTLTPAVIHFMHGVGVKYRITYPDYPGITTPQASTDLPVNLRLEVVDKGENRVLNHTAHNVGLVSTPSSANTFESIAGTIGATPYVVVSNGIAEFGYQGRVVGNYVLSLSGDIKDTTLAHSASSRTIEIIPGTVRELILDVASSITADDLLVSNLAYSGQTCGVHVPGTALCPKPQKRFRILLRDQFGNINNTEPPSKVYTAKIQAHSVSSSSLRWEEDIKIVSGQTYLTDDTVFRKTNPLAESVRFSISDLSPASHVDLNGNNVNIDYDDEVIRVVTPGVPAKIWIVQPADNTIDFPINVTVEVQDGQNIDGQGNGNLVSNADDVAVNFTLSSPHPGFTGLGPVDPRDTNTNDTINGLTATIRGGVGTFALESLIAELVDVSLTTAPVGFANRITEGQNGIYFGTVAGATKTVQFHPGAPRQYAINPRPANASLYDANEPDFLRRFTFPVKIFDIGGNHKADVSGKVRVQASIADGDVTLYNHNETVSTTDGVLEVDVINGEAIVKFTTTKSGIVDLTLLSSLDDPLNLIADPTVHPINVSPGPVHKFEFIQPNSITTTDSTNLADAANPAVQNLSPVTIRAFDYFDNFLNTYNGPSITVTSSSATMQTLNLSNPTLTDSFAFTNGQASLRVRNTVAEDVILSLSDPTDSFSAVNISSTTLMTFHPGPVAQFSLEVEDKFKSNLTTDATADAPVTMFIRARDIYQNHNTFTDQSTFANEVTISLGLAAGATADTPVPVSLTDGVGSFEVGLNRFGTNRFDATANRNLGYDSGMDTLLVSMTASSSGKAFMSGATSQRLYFLNGASAYYSMQDPDPDLDKTTDDTVPLYVFARDQYGNRDVSNNSSSLTIVTTGAANLSNGGVANLTAGTGSINITNSVAQTVTLTINAANSPALLPLPALLTNLDYSLSQELLFNPGNVVAYLFSEAKRNTNYIVSSNNIGPLTTDPDGNTITVDNAVRVYYYAVDSHGNINPDTNIVSGISFNTTNGATVQTDHQDYGKIIDGEGSVFVNHTKDENVILSLITSDLTTNTATLVFDHGVMTTISYTIPVGRTIDQSAPVTLTARDQFNNINTKYTGELTLTGSPAGVTTGVVTHEPYIAPTVGDLYDPYADGIIHLQQLDGAPVAMTAGLATVNLRALRATTFNINVDGAENNINRGDFTPTSSQLTFASGQPYRFEIFDPNNSTYDIYTAPLPLVFNKNTADGNLTVDDAVEIGVQAIDRGGNRAITYTQNNVLDIGVQEVGVTVDFKLPAQQAWQAPLSPKRTLNFTNGVSSILMRAENDQIYTLQLSDFTLPGTTTREGTENNKTASFSPGLFRIVTFPASNVSQVKADNTFTFSIEARDQFNNLATEYNGLVRVGLEVSPGVVAFPGDGNFPAHVIFPDTANIPSTPGATTRGVIQITNGLGSLAGFGGTLAGYNMKLVIVEDALDIDNSGAIGPTAFSHQVEVIPGDPAAFLISAGQASYTIDQHAMVTIQAIDIHQNHTPTYTGTVWIQSSNTNLYEPSTIGEAPGEGANENDLSTSRFYNDIRSFSVSSGGNVTIPVNSIVAGSNIPITVQSQTGFAGMTVGQTTTFNFTHGAAKFFRIIQPAIMSGSFHGTVDNPVPIVIQARDRGQQQIVTNYNQANLLTLTVSGGTAGTFDVYKQAVTPSPTIGNEGTSTDLNFSSGIATAYIRSRHVANLSATLTDPPAGTNIYGNNPSTINFTHGQATSVAYINSPTEQTTDDFFALEAEVRDQYNNRATAFVGKFKMYAVRGTLSYNGSVIVGGQMVDIPGDGTIDFEAADQGRVTLSGFKVRSSGQHNGGFQTVRYGFTAHDDFAPTGISLTAVHDIIIRNGVPFRYTLIHESPVSIVAGDVKNLRIRLTDENNNAVVNAPLEENSFRLSLNGPGAVPENTTINGANFTSQGLSIERPASLNQGIISLELVSTKTQSITASIQVGDDGISVAGATSTFNIISGPCVEITFDPNTADATTVDNEFPLALQARDQYANPATTCSASFSLAANGTDTLDFVAGKGVGNTHNFTPGTHTLNIPVQNKISGNTGANTITFTIQNPSAGIVTYSSQRQITFTYGAHTTYAFTAVAKAGGGTYTIDDKMDFLIWAHDQFGNRVLNATPSVTINSTLASPHRENDPGARFNTGQVYSLTGGTLAFKAETLKAELLTLRLNSSSAVGVSVGQEASIPVINGAATQIRIMDINFGSPANRANVDVKLPLTIEALDRGDNRVLNFNPSSAAANVLLTGVNSTETDLTTSANYITENSPYVQQLAMENFTLGLASAYVKSRIVGQFTVELGNLLPGLTDPTGPQTIEFGPGGTNRVVFLAADTTTQADQNFSITLQAQDQYGNHTPSFSGSIRVLRTAGELCPTLHTGDLVFIGGQVTKSDFACRIAGTVVLGLQNGTGTNVTNLEAAHNISITHGTTNLRLNLFPIASVPVSLDTTTTVRVELQDEYGNHANTLSGQNFDLTVVGGSNNDILDQTDSDWAIATRSFTIPAGGAFEIGLKSTVTQQVLVDITDRPADVAKVPGSGGRTFNFNPGPANKVAFMTTSLTQTTDDSYELELRVRDQFDNNTSWTGQVTVNASNTDSLIGNPLGQKQVTAGVATITIQRSAPTLGTPVEFTTSSALNAENSFFLTVNPGAPARIRFGSAPAGQTVDTAADVNISLQDQFGNNTVPTAGKTVTATLGVTTGMAYYTPPNIQTRLVEWSSADPATQTINVSNTVAQTATIAVTTANHDGEAITNLHSLPITFLHGVPTQFAYDLVPDNPKTDQNPILRVALQDQFGNIATSNSNQAVTLTLTHVSGINDQFTGGDTKTVSAGLANFTIESTTRQVLNAAITNPSSLTNPPDETINFLWGDPAEIVWNSIPASDLAGNTWSAQARMVDAKGNRLREYSGSSRLTLSWFGDTLFDGSTSEAPSIVGPVVQSWANGYAEWSVRGDGSGTVTLAAARETGPGTPAAASGNVLIDPGTPSRIIIAPPGSDGIVSLPTTVTAYLQDSFGNLSNYSGNITFEVREGVAVTPTTTTGYHNVPGEPSTRAITFSNAAIAQFEIRAVINGWVNVHVPNPPGGMTMQNPNGTNFYFMPGSPVEYKIVLPESPDPSLFHSTVPDSTIFHAATGVPRSIQIHAVDVSGSIAVIWGGCVKVMLSGNARPQESTVCLTSGQGTFEVFNEFPEDIQITLEDLSSDDLNDGSPGKDCTVANSCTATMKFGRSRAKELRITTAPISSSNQHLLPTDLYSPLTVVRAVYDANNERVRVSATIYDESDAVFTQYQGVYNVSGCHYVKDNASTFAFTNGVGHVDCSDPYKRHMTLGAVRSSSYVGTHPINLISRQYKIHNNTFTRIRMWCDGDNISSTDSTQSCYLRAVDSFGHGSTSGLENNAISEVDGLKVHLHLENNSGDLNPNSRFYLDANYNQALDPDEEDSELPGDSPIEADFTGTVNNATHNATQERNYIHYRFLVGNSQSEFVTVRMNNINYTGSHWTAGQISNVNIAATQAIYFAPAATTTMDMVVTANIAEPALATADNSHFYEVELTARTSNGSLSTTENGFVFLDVLNTGVPDPIDLNQVFMKNGVAGDFTQASSLLVQFNNGRATVFVSARSVGDIKLRMRHPGASPVTFIDNNQEKSFVSSDAEKLAILAPSDTLYSNNLTEVIQLRALDENDNIDVNYSDMVNVTFTLSSVDQTDKITNLSGGQVQFTNGIATLEIQTDTSGTYQLQISKAGLTSASRDLVFVIAPPTHILRVDSNSVARGAVTLDFEAQMNGILSTNFSGFYNITYKTSGGAPIADGSITGPAQIAITNGVGQISLSSSKAQSIDIEFTKVFTTGPEPEFTTITNLSFASGTPHSLAITSSQTGQLTTGALADLVVEVRDAQGAVVLDALNELSIEAHTGAGCSSLDNTGFSYSGPTMTPTNGVVTFTDLEAMVARTMSLRVVNSAPSPTLASVCSSSFTVYSPLSTNLIGASNVLPGETRIIEITGGYFTISLHNFSSTLGSSATLITSAHASCDTPYCVLYTAGSAPGNDEVRVRDSADTPNESLVNLTVTTPLLRLYDDSDLLGATFNIEKFTNAQTGQAVITVKNEGNLTTGNLVTQFTKDNADMWQVQNDFCEGQALDEDDQCTITLNFLTQTASSVPGSYELNMSVSGPADLAIETLTVAAEMLPPLEYALTPGGTTFSDIENLGDVNTQYDLIYSLYLRHPTSSSEVSSGAISVQIIDLSTSDIWSLDSSACDAADLDNGDACLLQITFRAQTQNTLTGPHFIKLRANSAKTGNRDLELNINLLED
jgi:hypothetical protein